MQPTAQVPQPVPIFYGQSPAPPFAIVLDNPFDWILTHVSFASSGTVPMILNIADENDVNLFKLEGAVPVSPATVVINDWEGEYPIGPRAGLNVSGLATGQFVAIAGYAVAPPTQLHV